MIVAISGSPRQGGNTEILLEAFLGALRDRTLVKVYRLQGMKLQGCKGCGGCYREGRCIFQDEVWSLYEELEGAKALVVSSPIYFTSITGQLKTFVDRAQPFWARKFLLHERRITSLKKGFFICVGGMEGDKYFNHAALVVKSFFNSLGIQHQGDLFYSAIDDKGEIRERSGAIEAAERAGEDFANL